MVLLTKVIRYKNANFSKKILIDELYSDEIRVVILNDGQIVEFEQESKEKKQIKGNIYIGVVKRIEPSLQAVFIDYEKGKQGFLSFSEISPSYYNIPEEEKNALLDILREEENYEIEKVSENGDIIDNTIEAPENKKIQIGEEDSPEPVRSFNGNSDYSQIDKKETSVTPNRNKPLYKRYKVQDVIRLDQCIMVQIIKEERGNKGASFSTYINLVGRYCIFMPNSENKGGISRRIEDPESRKNLKEIFNSMKLAPRSGVIIRTAGDNKSSKAIEQDLFYLQSLWQSIQNNAHDVSFPSLLYVEGDIVKRTLRDFCDESVKEVVISGNTAYEAAKYYAKFAFRNKLRFRLYKGNMPIFVYYKVEEQITQLYNNTVTLQSGAYFVINPTEALVSIDINSGKMKGESNIENMAYKTNMEAVKEIARQVILRGLSGLIVIDLIGMSKYEHRKKVEFEFREAFKNDRARIQFGYITTFGLLEISRQRVKQSIFEVNTVECQNCRGVGKVFSMSCVSTSALRDIKYVANKNNGKNLVLYGSGDIVSYMFNYKRDSIIDIERLFNVKINVFIDNTLHFSDFYIRCGSNIKSVQETTPLSSVSYHSEQHQETSEPQEVTPKKWSNFWLRSWFNRILSVK